MPSFAHHLPYFPLIVPEILGSDMEAFQRGAARQDRFWRGRELCFWIVYVGLCFAHHLPVAAVWCNS